MNESVDIRNMSDDALLSYLEQLEQTTRQGTINGNKILDKVNTISRQLSYRSHTDVLIKEKLDSIIELL